MAEGRARTNEDPPGSSQGPALPRSARPQTTWPESPGYQQDHSHANARNAPSAQAQQTRSLPKTTGRKRLVTSRIIDTPATPSNVVGSAACFGGTVTRTNSRTPVRPRGAGLPGSCRTRRPDGTTGRSWTPVRRGTGPSQMSTNRSLGQNLLAKKIVSRFWRLQEKF